jgi:nitrite reductase/ring-hydroxylating ferredoxin subunit
MVVAEPSYIQDRVRRPLSPPIPGEGECELFSQSWFPICLSADLQPGGVIGVDFLDGRVIAFRGAGGHAQVLSAYCVHLGADLSLGRVVGDRIRCAFHEWEYDATGTCAATGCGDEVPSQARVFCFPTHEKHGIVWAFNGEQPLFEIPDHGFTEHRLAMRVMAFPQILAVDPWVVAAHTPDVNRFCIGGKFEFLTPPAKQVVTTANSFSYRLHARLQTGNIYDVWEHIHGTNIFLQLGTLDGREFFWLTAYGLPRPGTTSACFAYGTPIAEGEDREEAEAFLEKAASLIMNVWGQDSDVVTTARFKPGLLTRTDEVLARYLNYVRNYPRAHPAAEFLQ